MTHGTFEHGHWTLEGDAPPDAARIVVATTDGEAVDAALTGGQWSARLAPPRRRIRPFGTTYDAEVRALRADGSIIASEQRLLHPKTGRPLGATLRWWSRRLTGRRPRGLVTYGPHKQRKP
jgi:hypothetical protein